MFRLSDVRPPSSDLQLFSHNKIEDTKKRHLAMAVTPLDALAAKALRWIESRGPGDRSMSDLAKTPNLSAQGHVPEETCRRNIPTRMLKAFEFTLGWTERSAPR